MKNWLFFLSLLSLITVPAQAKEAAAPPAGPTYVELAPSFVANYQSSKIRYLKADVTLMAENALTADAIGRHIPLIRHQLVMLFSRQSEESLQSAEGRQHLKDEALQEVINALQSEKEAAQVKEVLFTSFIVD